MIPGTGSIMLQALFGGIAGGLVVLKLYWHRIKAFFKREKAPETPNQGVQLDE